MCKHVAAALYGVGSRLDDRPELLFTLRGVDSAELIDAHAEAAVQAVVRGGKGRRIDEKDLESIFGMDVDLEGPPRRPARTRREVKHDPFSVLKLAQAHQAFRGGYDGILVGSRRPAQNAPGPSRLSRSCACPSYREGLRNHQVLPSATSRTTQSGTVLVGMRRAASPFAPSAPRRSAACS